MHGSQKWLQLSSRLVLDRPSPPAHRRAAGPLLVLQDPQHVGRELSVDFAQRVDNLPGRVLLNRAYRIGGLQQPYSISEWMLLLLLLRNCLLALLL